MKRLLPLLLLAAGCGSQPSDAPVAVSVIGVRPALSDPNRTAIDAPSAALIAATGQGLVRFDGAGQIEPGLAIRWDVSDDGLFYTFRLASDSPVDAEAAARRLRAAINMAGRNPLRHVLGALDEIVAVTDEILEIRLIAPRPDLLQLLAQPELALDPTKGTAGPYRAEGIGSEVVRLSPPPNDDGEPAPPSRTVLLRGEPAATAVARFMRGQARLVTGGTFADVAIGRLGDRRGRLFRIDPAPGLFGLAFTGRGAFLDDPAIRRALSMAVDRDRLVAAFGIEGWTAASGLLRGASDVPQPVVPDWAGQPPEDRRAAAAAAVAAWAEASGDAPPTLTVALPAGPGARMLMAFLRQDWAAIGVTVEPAARGGRADLELVDDVAPGGSAAWFLRHFTCDRTRICSEEADAALAAARTALSLEQRATHLADADRLLEEAVAFIPLASPLRWFLAAPDLDAVRENPRAMHPIYHLRVER